MKKKVICMLFNAISGDFEKTAFYTGLTRERALICFKEQLQGNFNSWEYPESIDGVYKSNVIKDRLLYNLTDDLIIYAQYA